MEIVGLIPAGGVAERLGKLPCSKEIMPLFKNSGKIRVTSEYLIHYYKLAGIKHIYFIIRKGKWDIPQYFGDGAEHEVNIGYLIMNLPFGTPFTLNQAYPFVKDKLVAIGFPDIIFEPENAYAEIKSKLLNTKAELVLGIAPQDNYLKSDMIEFNADRSIRNIVIKQNRPDLHYSWFIAIWKPGFSEYMNKFLNDFKDKYPDGKIPIEGISRELYVGDVIQSALADGMKAEYVQFEKGSYLDIGTFDDLNKLILNK